MGLAIIVHGGAGAMAADRHEEAAAGCREAALAGWRVLREGGSAVDAVQAAIVALEDNPGFNAGTGAVLTTDGRAQLDAGIMEGAGLHAGAVAGVERIKNPIVLARRVLESPHVLLMGAGAEQFAAESGMALIENSALITPAQLARWRRGYREGDDVNVGPIIVAEEEAHTPGAPSDAEPIHPAVHKPGTVGAGAVDAAATVAAGASTGGIGAKHPGRVGDTPIVGAGFCAENDLGGVSSTGRGEDFIRLLLARRALDLIGAGLSAQAAADAAVRLLGERADGRGGLILLDAHGRVGLARNTPTMAHAYLTDGMDEPVAGV